MDPVLDSFATGGTSSSGSSTSYSITTGNLRGSGILFVGTTCQAVEASLQNVSSVTVNGVSLSNIARVSANNGGGYGSRTELWALIGNTIPQSGTYTISITYAGSVEAIASGAMAFYNLRPASANVTATNSANGTNPLSVNITPTRANTLIVAIYGSQNDASVTVGDGQTKAYESRPSSALTNCGSYKILRAPGLTTMSAGFVNPESEEIIASAYESIPAGGNFIFNLL